MKKIFYEVFFGVLALVSVILAILDMKSGLNAWQKNSGPDYLDIICN